MSENEIVEINGLDQALEIHFGIKKCSVKELSRKDFRDLMMVIQEKIDHIPGSVQGDELNKALPVKHSFAPGIYVREMPIPKGIIIMGKIHKHIHPTFLIVGEAVVRTEFDGDVLLKAPFSTISQAGTKRLIFTLTDTVWITVHSNPGNNKNIDELEAMITAASFDEYDEFKKQEAEMMSAKAVA